MLSFSFRNNNAYIINNLDTNSEAKGVVLILPRNQQTNQLQNFVYNHTIIQVALLSTLKMTDVDT